MNSIVLDRAYEAVFYFQFASKQAVEYIVNTSQTDFKTAKAALTQALTGYKTKK